MKTTTLTKVALASSLFVLQPVYAGETSTSKTAEDTQLERQVTEQRNLTHILAHKMMGEINLASLALDVWQPLAAERHISKAEKIVSQLDDETEEKVINTTHKYGVVSYTTKSVEKNYYVPIVDDIMLVSDYDDILKDGKIAEAEKDASVVRLSLSVDLREVKKSLQEARTAIDNEKYDVANAAFSHIFTSSILDQEIITNPLWAVHDNLALAKIMLENENYGSARFALKHAKKHLKALESHGEVSVDAAYVKELDKNIIDLDEMLSKKDPTTLQKSKQKLTSWMGDLKSMF